MQKLKNNKKAVNQQSDITAFCRGGSGWVRSAPTENSG